MDSQASNPTAIASPNSLTLASHVVHAPDSPTYLVLTGLKTDNEEGVAESKQCCQCCFPTDVDDMTVFCRVCAHEICEQCGKPEFVTCCKCTKDTETCSHCMAEYCKYCGHLVCKECVHPECRGLERGKHEDAKNGKGEYIVGQKAGEDDDDTGKKEEIVMDKKAQEDETAREEDDISEEEKDTADCIQLCHYSQGDYDPEGVLSSCEHKHCLSCNEREDDGEDERGADNNEDWGTCTNGEKLPYGDGESALCLLPRYVQKLKCCGCGQAVEKNPIKCEEFSHEECDDCHFLEKVED